MLLIYCGSMLLKNACDSFLLFVSFLLLFLNHCKASPAEVSKEIEIFRGKQ